MGGYSYIFGPILSRRLGLSLGIDLVPQKTCSFDCVFCQVGRTPTTTLDRREYVPTRAVLDEFLGWVRDDGRADAITLAGAGEPTLHTAFGEVLREIRRATPVPTVLMTNSSLFHLDEVRAGAREAAVVKATVSAWDQASWERISRPHPSLAFEAMVEGLGAFAAAFAGELWIEVFLVRGVNDAPGDVERIAAVVNRLRPHRIHLNTVARPPAEPSARAVAAEALDRLARLFVPAAELAGTGPDPVAGAARRGAVLDLAGIVSRHPATAAELAAALGLGLAEVESELALLVKAGDVTVRELDGRACYCAGSGRG